MTTDIDNFSNAVAQIYDASIDVERWNTTLSTFAGMFDCSKAQIAFAESLHDSNPFYKFWGFSTDDLARGLAVYREQTPTDPRMPSVPFKVFHCRQLVSDEELHSSQLYRRALEPVGIEYAMLSRLDLAPDSKCVVALMRGPDQQPFSVADCENFSRFIPHFTRSVTMHRTFHRLRGQAGAAQQLIDGVPLGMMVLGDREVLLANVAARLLLEQNDAIRYRNGRLCAGNRRSDASLNGAIDEALNGEENPIGVSIPVGRDERISAVIRRLHSSSAGVLGVRTGAVALYLRDSRTPIDTPEEVLQQLFGLTRREAEVLQVLLLGCDTRGIATRLNIGVETAKTHLKHIMRITGVKRQAELVRLVLSSPGWMATQQKSKK